jgi:exopolysaccharide production protein ExoZ
MKQNADLKSKKSIYNIQIVRGLAALSVCCFHARYLLNNNYKVGSLLFDNGYMGVQLFFIISGFIMAYITADFNLDAISSKTYSWQFLKNRLIRIVPMYYLFTMAWILYMNQTNFFSLSEIKILISSFLFLPSANLPIYFIGWTINYEIFFYLLFSVSLFFKQYRYLFLIAWFLISVILLPNVVTLFGFTSLNTFPIYKFFTDFINLYFLAGIIIYLLLQYISLSEKLVILLFVISSILFGFIYFSNIHYKIMEILVFTIFMYSIISLPNLASKTKLKSFFLYLGQISFTIYLLHNFIIDAVPSIIHFFEWKISNLIQFFIILCLTIIFSALIYELLEKRLLQYFKKQIFVLPIN